MIKDKGQHIRQGFEASINGMNIKIFSLRGMSKQVKLDRNFV